MPLNLFKHCAGLLISLFIQTIRIYSQPRICSLSVWFTRSLKKFISMKFMSFTIVNEYFILTPLLILIYYFAKGNNFLTTYISVKLYKEWFDWDYFYIVQRQFRSVAGIFGYYISSIDGIYLLPNMA